MEYSHTQRIARALKWIVTGVFAVNLLVLPLLPGYILLFQQLYGSDAFSFNALLSAMRTLLAYENPAWYILFAEPLRLLFTQGGSADAHFWLALLFFLGCGLATAVLLWQARKVLTTIVEQAPFQMANARSLWRGALCCWAITLLALLRLAAWFVRLQNTSPLFTYTALLVPLSLVAGLLLLVMSALFRQAAELKEDQDLTI